VVKQFLKAPRKNNFVQPYGWIRWQSEAVKYFKGGKSLENASLETCIKLLTLHFRKDHFCTGYFGAMIEAGHIHPSRILTDTAHLHCTGEKVSIEATHIFCASGSTVST
jgi:hypothetical protein